MRLSSSLFKPKVPRSTIITVNNEHSFGEEKDVALALVGEHAQPIDPVLEARVVKRIDLLLIPTMFIGELSQQHETLTKI
jgi:hypothetical protein